MTRRHRFRIAELLCQAGRRLDDLGLVPSRDGNLSARIADDRLLVTPTGCRKRELEPSRLVEVTLDGEVVGAGRASTELGLHLAVYRRRPDVESVVHAHPPTAVGFACAGIGLTECLMPESAVHLGSVPLTAYATPGTPALEEAIAPAIEAHDAFLLANHGAVTFGGSVDEALDRMETLEHTARITFTATLLGGPTLLSADALADLAEIRARMGNPRPITCTPRPGTGSAPATAPIPGDLVDQVTAAVLAALRDGSKAP